MGNREQRAGPYEMPEDPKISDLFRSQIRNLRLALRTHTVCTVTAYNPTTQRVTVTVDILQVIKNNAITPSAANPAPTAVQDPVTLTNIPVAWPRTSSGYFTLPITPGDKGELHVQDRSLEAWLSLGTATDPVAAWTHNLADSVFHPAIFNAGDPITPPTDQTAAVIEGPLVKVGRNAVNFVALANLVLAELQAIKTWADSHAHSGVSTGPGTSGTPNPMPAPGSVAATKAQAE